MRPSKFRLALMVAVIGILSFLSVGHSQFYIESLKWDGDLTEKIITTTSDTTDVFYIPMDYRVSARYGKDYPTKLAWQFNTVEVNDSTHVIYKYQLSLDGTYWLTAVACDTITTEDGVSVAALTSWTTALYGRIIATAKLAAADTVTLSGTFCKIY